MTTQTIIQSDCIDFLRSQEEGSVDLVFGSPPYMDARTYGINAVRDCQEWVGWMLDVSEAAIHASKGLVLWVVAGVQRDNCYWPGCEGLAWEWWKRGHHLWRPCVWWKVDSFDGGTGIPGSGGKQWLRADWEYVLAFKREGWLPWADNTVMGHEPVYARGGEMSNRAADGVRINQKARGPWNTAGECGLGGRRQNGAKKARRRSMDAPGAKGQNGEPKVAGQRPFPKISNPGNVLPIVVKARVGGGHMGGDAFCSQNEAPFPEALAEFFVLSFCPPGGLCCDPFSGSGTTAAVCKRHGRNFVGCDLRQSQIDLGLKRLANETPSLFHQE